MILYEDNHLLVLHKPAGFSTQEAPGKKSIEAWAKNYLKEKMQKPGNVFLHAAHRLDTPVSGVVVFAKTSKALSRLQMSFRQKETEKIYQVWVEGRVTPPEAILEHWLVHGEGRALERPSSDPDAKKCRLHYKVLKTTPQMSYLEISLETGRYHQIRAQLALIGHPVAGDKKYGSKTILPNESIALHHARFSVVHPVKKELMVFEAPSPLRELF